jgi:hypothetical protein
MLVFHETCFDEDVMTRFWRHPRNATPLIGYFLETFMVDSPKREFFFDLKATSDQRSAN